ncbi:MAG: hypothetical protein RR350_07210 [Oscillibacter sp.]
MTVQNVFDISIRLMDAQNESTGATDTVDTKEYQLRSCSLLNSLLDRVYPASDTYTVGLGGKRPVCPKVERMTDALALDERICAGVLPYGLAALLLSEEQPEQANFFQQTFLENLAEAKRGIPSADESVEDVYGGLEYGGFSRW